MAENSSILLVIDSEVDDNH